MTAPNLIASERSASTALKVIDVGVKVALVVLILVAVMDPDLGGVKAKAGGSRAFAYPLAMMIVPAIWWLFYRTRSFPWLGDLLLCLPWFTDTLGNRLNLYDTIGSFDDWMHFMNWRLPPLHPSAVAERSGVACVAHVSRVLKVAALSGHL